MWRLLWTMWAAGASPEPVWRISLDALLIYPERSHSLAAAADHGALILADPKNHRLALTDAAGAVVAWFGKRGRGPGEFQSVDAVGWDPAAKVFVVADRANGRIVAISPKGALVSETRIDSPFRDPVFATDGALLLMRRGDGDGFRHSVWRRAGGEPASLHQQETARIATRLEWNPRLIFAGGREFVAINAGDTAEILLVHPQSGRRIAAFSPAAPRVPLSDDYYRERIRSLKKQTKGAAPAPLERLTRREEFWPFFHHVSVDRQNRIWVFLHAEPVWGERRFYAHRAGGERIADGRIAGAPQDVRDGFIYAVVEREDRLYLVKYEAPL